MYRQSIMSILRRKKAKIFVTTILIMAMALTYNYMLTSNKTSMTLSISYPGTEKGENPDGTRFNVFEIKSAEVIDRAIQIADLKGLTVDDIRNKIDIYAMAPKNITERVMTANKTGKNFYYIPNEFSISYSQSNKFSKNMTITVIEAIAKAYSEIFSEKYAEKNAILTAPFPDLSSYEYVEIADLYYDRVSEMERYIRRHASENGTFRSTTTNQTFENILVMLQNVKNIEIEKFRGFIVASNIAKDRDVYIQKLQHSNTMLDYDMDKVAYEKTFTTEAIKKYDPNITGVAFIPSLDSNNEFYMNRTKIGIDYLTDKAYNAGVFSERYKSEINKNNQLIANFSTNVPDAAQLAVLTKQADDMLKTLDEKIKIIAKIATDTDNEYLSYKTQDYLKFDIPKRGFAGMFNIKKILLVGIIAFVLMCFYVVVSENFKRRERRK